MWDFFAPALAEVLHWSLSDGKSPQFSRTLLGILADLNNVVVLMVSTRHQIEDRIIIVIIMILHFASYSHKRRETEWQQVS